MNQFKQKKLEEFEKEFSRSFYSQDIKLIQNFLSQSIDEAVKETKREIKEKLNNYKAEIGKRKSNTDQPEEYQMGFSIALDGVFIDLDDIINSI